jgi:hypothetical protein
MAQKITGKIEIDNPNQDQLERLNAIETKLDRIEQILTTKLSKSLPLDEPIAQIDAMLMLRTTFPTFKKRIAEYKIRPIIRGSRVFYEAADINRILKGRK